MSASLNLPLHHEVQKFSSGTGSPGWSQKNGRKTVVVQVNTLWQDANRHILPSATFLFFKNITEICKQKPLTCYSYSFNLFVCTQNEDYYIFLSIILHKIQIYIFFRQQVL